MKTWNKLEILNAEIDYWIQAEDKLRAQGEWQNKTKLDEIGKELKKLKKKHLKLTFIWNHETEQLKEQQEQEQKEQEQKEQEQKEQEQKEQEQIWKLIITSVIIIISIISYAIIIKT